MTANLETLGVGSNNQTLKWTKTWFHPLVEDALFLGINLFVGVGLSWYDDHPWKDTDVTATRGAGIRYLIARQYGLHMGLDVAFGVEGSAICVQFGSAWNWF